MHTLEDNINRAASTLPVGWIIAINVEFESGCVDLYDPEGYLIDISGDKLTINQQVEEAIKYAIEHA